MLRVQRCFARAGILEASQQRNQSTTAERTLGGATVVFIVCLMESPTRCALNQTSFRVLFPRLLIGAAPRALADQLGQSALPLSACSLPLSLGSQRLSETARGQTKSAQVSACLFAHSHLLPRAESDNAHRRPKQGNRRGHQKEPTGSPAPPTLQATNQRVLDPPVRQKNSVYMCRKREA